MKQDKTESLSAAEFHQVLTAKDVITLVGLKTRQSVWRWVKQNKLPAPRYASPHAPRWYLGEILEHHQKQSKVFKDAPRGLKGQVETEYHSDTKVSKLLERFGLKNLV